MSIVKMKGSKLCLKSYDNNGVVNNVFFVQKDLPCPNLLGKLQDLGAVEAVTPDMVEVSISRYFLYIFLVVLLNYFMIKKQLNPKSNGDAKNQGSTTKFKPLAWIQRSEWNRARAVIFSSWMMILQFSFAHDACTLASVLTYQAYLTNLEWTESYIFSSFNAAVRILLFTLGTFGSLCPIYHTMKAQIQYIRALIDLELSPEQTAKDESSIPQELPASAPPSSFLQQTSPYLGTNRESPCEHEKRVMETTLERHTPTPVSLVLPPRSYHAHSRTTAQQPTSEAGQQGSQTTALRLSRSAPVGNAPPSCTDSTTNGANDVSRQAAFDALVRRLDGSAVSRQRQQAFKSRPASSSTGRVPVGQALGGDAATSSDSPAQSEDWEYVHHEE
ncbi:uncharacterized protein FMAN_02796 [Fusarium mangiferae]|uniref:Uncharacterized protein n=1 Tax=Fusarium mangiferae TaxID=192010 RepID=A0A1L7T3P6_FUSMA|nr:uncharacterized protein FMAN_02796 [Fusarium mangiferae]CVK93378.1 uncharacterized protein FMAN_02796 [Fusarium mangiferae]